MKYRVIDLPDQLDMHDGNRDFVTFVYRSADPTRSLELNEFFYVNDEDELNDKIALLDADKQTLEEVQRL